MVATGVLLPRGYIYPSLSAEVARARPRRARGRRFRPRRARRAARRPGDPQGGRRRARTICSRSVECSSSWRRSRSSGCTAPPAPSGGSRGRPTAAAACVGLSWEYAYHARWVANDCLLTQFAALALYMLALYRRSRRPGWIYAAAVAVGLGTGAKFPGVTLLLPVLAAGVALRPGARWRSHLARGVALSAVAFAAYLVTTPGTVLDPFKFIEDGRRISSAYQGTHFGYSVSGAAQHWRVAISYLALAFFSPFMGVAAALFACALVGAVAWARADRSRRGGRRGLPAALPPGSSAGSTRWRDREELPLPHSVPRAPRGARTRPARDAPAAALGASRVRGGARRVPHRSGGLARPRGREHSHARRAGGRALRACVRRGARGHAVHGLAPRARARDGAGAHLARERR